MAAWLCGGCPVSLMFGRVGLLCWLSVLVSLHPASAGLPAGQAPDFALKSLSGENLRLSEYRGDVVVLSIWAPWCGTCLEQLRAVERLRAGMGDARLRVLSVSVDRDVARTRRAAARLHIEHPVLIDSEKTVARAYDPERLPMTVLIGAGGAIREAYTGYGRGDEQEYRERLDALLAE